MITILPNKPGVTLGSRIDQLRAYLGQHPGTKLTDLEHHEDREGSHLHIIAKKLLERGELIAIPNGVLVFKDQGHTIIEDELPEDLMTVRILEDIGDIAGSQGRIYSLKKEDVLSIPASMAKALIRGGKAVEMGSHMRPLEDATTVKLEALPGVSIPSNGAYEAAKERTPNDHITQLPLPAEAAPWPMAEPAPMMEGPPKPDRPYPDSLEGAQELLEFIRRCRDEDMKTVSVPRHTIGNYGPRMDDAGELLITAEIDGGREEWRYRDLEAEISDHIEDYPPLALEMLQDKKRAFMAMADRPRGRVEHQGKERGKKKAELPAGEMWVEGEGEDAVVGFSSVRHGEIFTRTVPEWREIDTELADLIEREYDYARGVYCMPGRPNTGYEDKDLLKDIIQALDRFIDLPPGEGKINGIDSPYRTSTAAHIACTAFYDMVAVRPGLIPVAETKTGKTRLITICTLSSYHGLSIGAPTEAVVLRALGSYHVTLCIDECLDNADILPLILTIYKLSFDGQNVARCDLNDQRKIITYPCKGFVTLSLKNLDSVPDDSVNRGIVVRLGYKTRELEDQEPSNPEFALMFKGLRTRVAALRLRALAGKVDVPAALDRAGDLAHTKYAFRGREYVLDSRDFTKAQTLLLPIVLMGEDERQIKEVMEVMLRSKLESDAAQGQSLAAKCWYALYREIDTRWSRNNALKLDGAGVPIPIAGMDITTKIIADTVRADLKNEGELLKDGDLKTRTVTEALKSLLFVFRSGAHRASYLVTDDSSFPMAWRNCVQKYGLPTIYHEEEAQSGNRAGML